MTEASYSKVDFESDRVATPRSATRAVRQQEQEKRLKRIGRTQLGPHLGCCRGILLSMPPCQLAHEIFNFVIHLHLMKRGCRVNTQGWVFCYRMMTTVEFAES